MVIWLTFNKNANDLIYQFIYFFNKKIFENNKGFLHYYYSIKTFIIF